MKDKVISKVSNLIYAGRVKAAMASTAIMAALPQAVSATSPGGTGEVNNVVYAVADVIVNIFPFVGIFFILAGVFKMVMAYRDNRPEDQAAAAKDIVIGAVFIVFKVFAWAPIKAAL